MWVESRNINICTKLCEHRSLQGCTSCSVSNSSDCHLIERGREGGREGGREEGDGEGGRKDQGKREGGRKGGEEVKHEGLRCNVSHL